MYFKSTEAVDKFFKNKQSVQLSRQKKKNLFSVLFFCTTFLDSKVEQGFATFSGQNQKRVQTFFDHISLNTYFFGLESGYNSSLRQRQYQPRKQRKPLLTAFLLTFSF
jgi:hypothetical protein